MRERDNIAYTRIEVSTNQIYRSTWYTLLLIFNPFESYKNVVQVFFVPISISISLLLCSFASGQSGQILKQHIY